MRKTPLKWKDSSLKLPAVFTGYKCAADSATKSEVPGGQWFKRFPAMTVCGEGEWIKTFLDAGQAPFDRVAVICLKVVLERERLGNPFLCSQASVTALQQAGGSVEERVGVLG